MMLSLNLLFAFFSLFNSGCSKKDSTPVKVAPTNLVVSAVVSATGNGKVDFTASATNAVTFTYDFADGETATTTLSNYSHTYKTVGTNTYKVTVTAKSGDGLTLQKSIDVTVLVKPPFSTLVWSEEFNTDGAPDPAKWGYDLGAGGWGNSELEYYTNRPDNAIVDGGVLKIKALKENYLGSAYTSARLLSKDKFDFKYGKVEARAKIPAGVGTWPAIWMLGSNISTAGWPACGEIDIMEHVGKNLNTIYGTLHYPGHSGGSANGATTVIPTATTDFHIYGLEWTETSIKILVDGVVFHTVPNNSTVPFNQNFFFILNVAMGGNFGGPMDASITSAVMEVDYVRVYQ